MSRPFELPRHRHRTAVAMSDKDAAWYSRRIDDQSRIYILSALNAALVAAMQVQQFNPATAKLAKIANVMQVLKPGVQLPVADPDAPVPAPPAALSALKDFAFHVARAYTYLHDVLLVDPVTLRRYVEELRLIARLEALRLDQSVNIKPLPDWHDYTTTDPLPQRLPTRRQEREQWHAHYDELIRKHDEEQYAAARGLLPEEQA